MKNTGNKIHIAIFASGSGTNAENCMRYFDNHPVISVSLIVTNNPEAGVIHRAAKFHVPVRIFNTEAWKNPEHVLAVLQTQKINFIVLAGFLKLLPAKIIDAFPQRIINIHPALLPKYGGKGMYGHKVHEAVFANHETETGITIHFVNEEYDKGDIIFQKAFAIDETDTPKSIEEKVRDLEIENLPKVIEYEVLR